MIKTIGENRHQKSLTTTKKVQAAYLKSQPQEGKIVTIK